MSLLPEPLRIPAFRFYWLARLTSTIAQMAMVIVIGWQVYDIARETMGLKEAAFRLGIIGLVQFVPLFALTLITGWTADRVDRRWIARASIALELGLRAALGVLAWRGDDHAVRALRGRRFARRRAAPSPARRFRRARAQSRPARDPAACDRFVVDRLAGGRDRRARARRLSLRLDAVSRPTPPARPCSRSPSPACSRSGRSPGPRSRAARNPWAQMVEGLHYVRHNRLVLGAISLDLFAVLLGGATAMLPVFARDVLHAGPEGLGHLRAAPAVGATLTALVLLGPAAEAQCRGRRCWSRSAIFGAATVVFGLSRWMPLSLACLALLGAADMFSVYVRQSLIQLYTPDAMRGRVGAVSSLFISASNELGEAESGFLGALIGPVAAVIAGGVGAIGVVVPVGVVVSRAAPCKNLRSTRFARSSS